MRATSPFLEEILGQEFQILDHGFIKVVDYMGNDSAIVQAARVSYGAGTKTVNEDKGLINYLVKHNHTSPLEMCEIKMHLKMPFFIARQWLRHRTASVNEYSARYSILSNQYYIPSEERMQMQSKNNKQGSGGALPAQLAEKVKNLLEEDAKRCYSNYDLFLSEEVNLARELARMNLTLNYYTEFYWKVDLHNLLHFIKLRAHQHAQYEIRVYAEKILDIVKLWCPFAAEAFNENIMGAVSLSIKQQNALKKIIANGNIPEEETGLSKREYAELLKIIK